MLHAPNYYVILNTEDEHSLNKFASMNMPHKNLIAI